VRSHAKASTAGSTQRRAGRLGRIFHGADLTRDASLDAKGSSGLATRRVVLPLSAFVAILALMIAAVPAGATKSHLLKETFGSAAQPSFNSPTGLAVDQSTGDLLVINAGNSTIRRYKPDGTPDNFSALGTNVIDGTGSGDETPQGGLSFGGAAESQIAVDNSGGATDGDIYVTQGFPNVINIFAETGAYLGQLSESSGGPFSEACGVAVDPSGAVYVGDFTSGIHKFAPAANPPVNADNTANFSSVTNPCALAAGAGPTAGFLFAAQYFGPISKLDSATGEVKYEVSSDSHTTLTVDPGTGHVYGATGSTVKEFDASGVGSAVQVSSTNPGSVEGVAVSGASGELYVSRENNDRVLVFGAPIATVPDVVVEAATNNSGVHATLNGTVNPDGVELSECFFEYGTTSFNQTAPCAETPAAIGTGTSPVAVHADIGGLAPNGTHYSFRLVAKNPEATAQSGSIAGFTTPDTVITEAASAQTLNGATLNGSVNPDGVAMTECLFEWGTSTSYGETAPCVPNAAGIGSGTSPVAVHADLSGLHVGTVYHYRLKAANANGPILGEDMSVQTTGPVVGGVWSEDVIFTEATLKAEINPEGNPTTYRFEWGTDASYGNSSPESNVGSDSSSHEVSAFLEGLQPATTYHYRVVATNGVAENEGADHTFTTPEPFALDTNCTNQSFRVGPGANLPDCRAYEMVSPVDKGGRGIVAGPSRLASSVRAAFDQAAVNGNGLTYTSATSFGDEPSNRSANQYLARRGADAWTTHGISPPLKESLLTGSALVGLWAFDTPFSSFSDDLSSAWLRDPNRTPLASGGVEGFGNIYRRDNADGTYHDPVITNEPLLWPEEDYFGRLFGREGLDRIAGMAFRGRSRDGSHVIFEAAAQLTPDASASTETPVQIYDHSGGELHLVSVLPGGAPSPGARVATAHTENGDSFGDDARANAERAVSEDGSRVFWTASGVGVGALYVRVNGTTTVPISESVTNGPSRFQTASTDGSKVIFSFGSDPQTEDFYEFDVDTETPTLIAHNVTAMAGASKDLSYFYFVSRDALDTGATAGQENLYLRHEGTIKFIATVTEKDVSAQRFPSIGGHSGVTAHVVNPALHGVRVTPDGRHLAFMSSASLTGYDNTDALSGKADVEVFLYDAGDNGLTCVSCNPSGARPHGGGARPSYGVGAPENPKSEWQTAASIPPSEHELDTSRVLSDDGNRVFFNAMDALVPEDTNGHQDVYEWERQGAGTCQKPGGCISLISTGKSNTYSEFVDASADGRDVFFRTESSIDPRDPGLMDIYDAREGGGLPPPPPPTQPCLGDACQSAPPAPNDPTPASASFHGAGDPRPKKANRHCRARSRHTGKNAKGKAKHKKSAKACKRTKRGAGR